MADAVSFLTGVDWRWYAVLLAGILIVSAIRRRREDFSVQRDPQRMFTVGQKQLALAWCGSQCEHKPLLGRRCRLPATDGDHVYPWSFGGATSIENLQMLCGRHNRRKSNHPPSRLYMWRLGRRRLKYYPADVPTQVVWQFGAAAPARRQRVS